MRLHCHLSPNLRPMVSRDDDHPQDLGEYPDPNELLDALEQEPSRPVTVVRLSRNATTVTTPGGSSAVCRVDFDRPLTVAAAIGQVSRMEHDAAPEVVRQVAPWARPLLLRYEREETLVFGGVLSTVKVETDDLGWGPDEEDCRVIAQTCQGLA